MRKTGKKAIFPVRDMIPGWQHFLGPAVPESASLFVAMLYAAEPGAPLTILAPDAAQAERITAELPLWLKALALEAEVMLLPEGTIRADQVTTENDSPRSLALARMLTAPPQITVASIGAALSAAPAPENLRNATIQLQVGDTFSMTDLAGKLVELDYDDELEVTIPGEFARRGGLMDVFSFSEKRPARLEFFGDEIDSIRLFDPSTQLSVEKVNRYQIIMRAGAAASRDSESDFLDYVPGKTVLLFPALAERHLERYGNEKQQARFRDFCSRDGLCRILDSVEVTEFDNVFQPKCFTLDALIRSALPDDAVEDYTERIRQWNSGIIARWIDDGIRIVVNGKSESDLVHLREWLTEAGLPEDGKSLAVRIGDLPFGIFLPGLKRAFLTERELFGLTAKTAPRRIAPDQENGPEKHLRTGGEDLSAFAELDEGDYAVHIQHGICIYRGLSVVSTGGATAEMISLEFDDGAMMHVPLWQAHCISKYIGSKKTVVHLNKLASAKWGKTRAAAARSVQALAYGMLRMQAVRKTVHTTPYPADGLEQRMFEEAFPFRETADQLRAADEIKKDMECARPMDRLLCGDVGFGKTELAMRAAFKAVSAGRQVAVLVPTTVLAQQHYYSFLERFAGTPVMIEQLSRFRTKGEQTEILRRLREGSLDIVIGTHRLVQEDVRFHDLGLIVIDEEQRFGVQHKERLKRLRVSADVLTMTATPIPRTLYMSMSGMRDLSTIMSAPVQRLPVRTIVAQSEENVIRTAISRELERGGQVYYLYNRVATIEEEAAKIQMMFPGARIGIGHGKMNEHELEDVMSRFIEGKMDILVCTTIIESGLDIPNANTIIIDRADRFGLAELYQLRGRVGRWTRQAYAYMLLPKSGILTGDARKRISAIRSYTHLGAGFKLAVRDLEIRGAGNILGAEQSGQIHAVGFHLYCELLRSCVTQLKGETLETPPETDLFMDFLVFAGSPPKDKTGAAFTEDYINSPKLRIDAYRRLAAISTEARLDDFENELRDRYGKLPPFAVNLLDCARIRLIASACGIESVTCRDDRAYLQLPDASFLKPGGMVPRLTPSFTPVKKLHQLLDILKEIRRKRK